MADHVYKLEEWVGSSPNGIEDAIQNAVRRAAESGHTLRWFQVKETRGQIVDGKVAHWQVTVQIGSRPE